MPTRPSPDHTWWWQQGTVEKALAWQDKNATFFAQETVRTCCNETDKGNWKTLKSEPQRLGLVHVRQMIFTCYCALALDFFPQVLGSQPA